MTKFLLIPERKEVIKAYGFLLLLLLSLSFSLSTFARTADISTAAETPTVYTDKPDYAPGETVIITGTGWEPGEQVKLEIDHSTVTHGNTVLYAKADENGHIYNNDYLIEQHHLGESFILTTTGQESGLRAKTTFTDSRSDYTVSFSSTTACVGTAKVFRATFRNISNSTDPSAPNRNIGNIKIDNLKGTVSNVSVVSPANWTVLANTNAEVQVIAGSGTPIAPGSSITIQFTYTSENSAGTKQWSMDVKSGTSSLGSGDSFIHTNDSNVLITKDPNKQNITVSAKPTTANAGADQTITGTSATLAGNAPSAGAGTGSWSIMSGTGGNIANPASRNSTFTGTAGTIYTLRWTIATSAECTSSDDVNITFVSACNTAAPTGDGTQSFCNAATVADLEATGSNLKWYSSSSGGTALVATTALVNGNNYYASQTVGNCESTSRFAVAVTISQKPTAADAGSDETICSNQSQDLAANSPSIGTGAWSIVSGPSTSTFQFSSTTSPTATFKPTGGEGSYVLRWTISNAPCPASTSEVTITVNDQIDPVITSIPDNTTVSCASQVPEADDDAVEASDNCGGDVAISHSDEITNRTCANRYTINRTYTATDASGNTSSRTQIITVNDQTDPVVQNCPSNMTVAPTTLSGAVVNYTIPTASDNCGGTVDVDRTSGPASGTLFPIGKTTVTYEFTDDCGNKSICSFNIIVTSPYCDAPKNKKVYVCHNGNTICISVNAMQEHLDHGDKLGPCTNNQIGQSEEINVTAPLANNAELKSFKVTFAPNPSNSDFRLKVESNSNDQINIRVIDALGRVMTVINGVEKNSPIIFGENYRRGYYFVEVVQGANLKTVKLIKLD